MQNINIRVRLQTGGRSDNVEFEETKHGSPIIDWGRIHSDGSCYTWSCMAPEFIWRTVPTSNIADNTLWGQPIRYGNSTGPTIPCKIEILWYQKPLHLRKDSRWHYRRCLLSNGWYDCRCTDQTVAQAQAHEIHLWDGDAFSLRGSVVEQAERHDTSHWGKTTYRDF
jgi:hypothetical protein